MMRLFLRTGVATFLLLVCASTAFSQRSENKDDKADAIVKKTEVWPHKIALPASMEMKELVYAKRGKIELDLTYFTRKETRKNRPAILFVHGGSWKHGDKFAFYRQAAYLTEKYNLFSVCITYRIATSRPGELQSLLKNTSNPKRFSRGKHVSTTEIFSAKKNENIRKRYTCTRCPTWIDADGLLCRRSGYSRV